MFQFRKTRKVQEETALRARDIVGSAFRVDKKNTQHVSLAKSEDSPRGWKLTTITKIPGQRARMHIVRVELPRGYEGKFRACDGVKIDCNCGRYKFVWNYALGVQHAAIKDRTNGMPPDVTNPSMETGACKHLLIALKALIAVNPAFPGRRIARKGHPREGKKVTLTSLKQARVNINKPRR